MNKVSLLLLTVILALSKPTYAPGRAVVKPRAWSKPVNGIQARLCFTREEALNGTPIITTYLELKNVSDSARVLELPVDGEDVQLEFTVTNSAGKKIPPDSHVYDELWAPVGLIRLPFDSLMRINIAHRGAGVPKDHAAHLDLGGPFSNWDFKRGDKESYYVEAKLQIKDRDGKRWSGTLAIPRAKLPTTSE
jgi:hypothetical protein